MKILYFLPKLQNCGPANVVLNNIRELKESNPDINIGMISYRNNEETDNYKVSCQKLGVDEFYSLDDKKNFFQKYFYLKEITKASDIIHSNGFFPDLYCSILPKHLVKVSTVHSVICKDYPATYGTLRGSFYALLHHLVYLNPNFNNIIACSNEVKKHIRKYSILNRRKISTIHNGINQKQFSNLNLEEKTSLKEEIFKSLSIEMGKHTKVFVYSGRLTRLKRVPELIQWFLKLPITNNILIVLGDGDEKQQCIETAENSKNIFFLGFVDETIPYYQIADYIISNSSLEGFPMGILEGMSCGCKALLSDIPAHREVIKYFPNISTLLDSFNCNNTASNATAEELCYLSATRMAGQYLSSYKESLNKRATIKRKVLNSKKKKDLLNT